MVHSKVTSLKRPSLKGTMGANIESLTKGALRLWGWAPPGSYGVGRSRDTLRLGTAGIFCGRALRGHSAVEQCRDRQSADSLGHHKSTLRLGTARIVCSCALRDAM